ncbi:palmdelphin [Physeter macrocephalus]|uniref:Palmdelphin n=1 Tax=Physeter macrocephalus TaxID=9755 RepID=A0A2Y9F1M6_PHYMC|nr:palmdelphin [Physeter catodon]|eukprot:XP_007112250.1 palmdelphin [Physeter catodon]
MEEAELVKERLQAITDKRKIQEEISQKRLKIEEEKLKHQHLKKKALREKWLLDGISSGKEQEEMKKQNQQDQHQIQVLEKSILRLEKEIQDLEKAELQISTNEEAILKKLKSVERTTEDIIRSVKVEKEETSGESIEDIYANIPDLPKSYIPSRLRKERNEGIEDDEQNRKALYAMEIKVEKDLKTGESTVLSSIPLPSDNFKGTGIKVYDDGQKSVYAVSSNHSAAYNGTDGLAPVEVEELLRQASERNSKSPTEYHEPVYANPFCRPTTPQREKVTPGPNFQERIKIKANGLGNDVNRSTRNMDNGLSEESGNSFNHISPVRPIPQPRSMTQQAEETPHTQQQRLMTPWEESNVMQDRYATSPKAGLSPSEALVGKSERQGSSPTCQEDEEDIRYNIVHSLPSDMDEKEPVTMIFMGYQQAEDNEEEKELLMGYDGVIHAELVVIDEEEEEGEGEAEKLSYHPIAPYSQVFQPAKPTPLPRKRSEVNPHENTNHKSPHKNSISLKEQEESLGSPVHRSPLDVQIAGDGTEDPSLTALRMRMAKLGKKVI